MSLSGQQLLDGLVHSNLVQTDDATVRGDLVEEEDSPLLILWGLVRLGEGGDTMDFSPGTDCQQWQALPVDVIDEAEPLGLISCGDDSYQLVLIQINNTNDAVDTRNFLISIGMDPVDVAAFFGRGMNDSSADRVGENDAPTATDVARSFHWSPPHVRLYPTKPILPPPFIAQTIQRLSRMSGCAKCLFWANVVISAAAIAFAGGPAAALAALEKSVSTDLATLVVQKLEQHVATDVITRELCRQMGKCSAANFV